MQNTLALLLACRPAGRSRSQRIGPSSVEVHPGIKARTIIAEGDFLLRRFGLTLHSSVAA